MSQSVINDDLEIAGVLKALSQTKTKLWCWQNTKVNGLRPVHYCQIQKVDQIKKLFYIKPTNKNGFRFVEKEPIFIFAQQRCIACKLDIRDLNKQGITLGLPDKLNVLDETFIDQVQLVEKEDEVANEHKREVPRKTANSGQMVGVRKIDSETGELDTLDFYTLYDMSKGGMGLKSSDPAEFQPGDKVGIVSVDGKSLAKRIEGVVMSVRQTEDIIESFKVGIKFG